MSSLSSSVTLLSQKNDTILHSNTAEHERFKKTFSSQKLAMEIRMQRLKLGLTNVPSRLLHRQQLQVKHQRDNLFECLIDDILIYMGQNYISLHDLWSLSRVSRRCASLFVPLMYAHIDLRLRRTFEIDVKSKGLTRNGNNREGILQSQRRIRKNLIRQPHYNVRIRTLMWYLDDREMRTSFWDILKHMVNIETLWICSPYGSPYCPDSETFDQYTRGGPVAPSTTFTRSVLSDTISRSSLIPSSSSSTLVIESSNETIVPHCRHLTLQGIVSLAFAKHLIHPAILESFSIDCTPRWTVPILSYLAASPASFPRLTNLSLIFPCGTTLPSSSEIDLLKSWRHILHAYHASLEHVTISSRLTSQGYYVGPPLSRPSFELLNTYIFPLFLGEYAVHEDEEDDLSIRRESMKWEHLKVLNLKGRSMVERNGDVFRRLWMSVPELVVDPSADTEDTLWHNQFAYSVLLR